MRQKTKKMALQGNVANFPPGGPPTADGSLATVVNARGVYLIFRVKTIKASVPDRLSYKHQLAGIIIG